MYEQFQECQELKLQHEQMQQEMTESQNVVESLKLDLAKQQMETEKGNYTWQGFVYDLI